MLRRLCNMPRLARPLYGNRAAARYYSIPGNYCFLVYSLRYACQSIIIHTDIDDYSLFLKDHVNFVQIPEDFSFSADFRLQSKKEAWFEIEHLDLFHGRALRRYSCWVDHCSTTTRQNATK
jgi:hypothetical protein